MIQVRTESIALFLGTNRKSSVQTLSVRLTPLLISAGLVNGTTLTFGLRLLKAGIQDIVLYAPDGTVADIPRQITMF
jgi:hypothetical protein